MIKGFGFGRLLKQLFFTLLISSFVFLGGSFVSATFQYFQIGLDKYQSYWNTQYNIGFLKKGRFLSDYLGTTKALVALNNNYLIWWNDGGLYTYGGGVGQGYFQYVKSCDEITVNTGDMSTCTEPQQISYLNNDIVVNFISSLTTDDWVYIEDGGGRHSCGGYCNYDTSYLNVCFSSHSLGSTLCFVSDWSSYNNSQYYGAHTPLVGSLGYSNMSFANISYSVLSDPPGFAFAGDLVGSEESSIDSSLTGDYTYSDCTWQDIFTLLESEGYNKYICYAGLTGFSRYDSTVNYNVIPGSGLTIQYIWANSGTYARDSFTDWFYFWNGLYIDTSNDYTAMWESYPAVWHSYFQLYNTYKGAVLEPRTILEYCNVRLVLTGSSLKSSANGYFKPFCSDIVREKQTGIWDSRVDGTIYSGGIYTGYDGYVPISVNWNGVGNMSGLNSSQDGITFFQNFFNLAKSKISTNGYTGASVGFIPSYIIVFMLALIFFRFFKH